MHLNPFNKALDSLSATDLECLRHVAEGWYVEYKREPIPARTVGKSLSAFANHFGGWLIFGVDARNRTPGAFPGLSRADVDTVMASLRDAARAHVNPTVVYEAREIVGPAESLNLPEDRSVVVALVRQGHNPPYIHSSGRIYRRIDDASEPKAETDRAVLDQLTERASEYRDQFRKKIETRPEFSKGESEMPCLQVHLTTDPWQERRIEHLMTHHEFASIMARKDDAAYSIALESSFPSGFGFTARHVASNDPFNMLYTWESSYSGFSSVIVPLRTISEQTAGQYKYIRPFFEALPSSLRGRVIDATALWIFFASIIAKQDAIAKLIGVEGSLFARLRFINVWRLVPFLDTESYIHNVRAYGLPIIQVSERSVPPGTTPNDMTEIVSSEEASSSPQYAELIRAGGLLRLALGAMGISHKCITGEAELQNFTDILARAIRVHTGRGV